MRATILAAFLLLGLTAARAPDPIENNFFISPAGEPFTAPSNQPFPIVLWFNGADANHDGKLDLTEFQADGLRFFKTLDRNNDGVLDSREIYIYEHLLVPQILSAEAKPQSLLVRVRMQDDDKPAHETLNTQQGAVQFGLFPEPEPLLSADRNLDGRVTLKEFQAQADRHFVALDRDNKGYLTLDGLPQTPAEKLLKAKRH
jgi:hypothetical protein